MLDSKVAAMVKIAPSKDNSSNFKSVPREMIIKKLEKEKASVPPVGGYRPKHNFVEHQSASKVAYGTKSKWELHGK